MQHDGDQHGRADDRPKPPRLGEVGVGDRVGEVVEASEAANAEEGDGEPLPPRRRGRQAPGQRSGTGERADKRQEARHGEPVHGPQAVQQPACQGTTEQHKQHHHQQPFDLVGELVHALVKFVVALRLADRDGGNEHREEPVALRKLRERIGKEAGAERHETVARVREAGSVGDAEHQPAQRAAHEPADGDPRRELPEHRHRNPLAPALGAGPAAGHGEEDRQVHEGEGQPVVQPRLGGEGEAHLVLLARAGGADLDVARQHRVGRRERRAQQQRGGERQAQPPTPDGRGGEDAQRHGDSQKPPHRGPCAEPEAPVELQAGAGEGHDDDELREAFRQLRIGERVRRLARCEGEGNPARADAKHGQRKRQLPQHQGQPCDEQDERAAAGEEDEVGVQAPATRREPVG